MIETFETENARSRWEPRLFCSAGRPDRRRDGRTDGGGGPRIADVIAPDDISG